MVSVYEERVIEKIRSRAAVGLQKYGTTMAREDLSNLEWLNHLQEELLDGAIYIERLRDIVNELEGAMNERKH
tara:strand:+ start:3954 stop:4172 length:219 start_codon:yes stop_codon:yes gene_type:complete